MELDDEEKLSGRRQKRALVIGLVSIPFFAAMGFGVWFFLAARQRSAEKTLVEQVSVAAFGCVGSMRGDAPEGWGLERALEHMSRMERVTREGETPGPSERERFAGLAADAARGCHELGSLMMRARAEAPHLYFAVPTKLAQPPDEAEPERWFRRVLPKSRAEVLELTRQIRAMQEAINARRNEHEMMPTALPIEGGDTSRLARLVLLTPIERGLERQLTEVWPLPEHVLVLRRGSIPRVACDTRYINRASCYTDFVQTVSWTGEPGPQRTLERPARVSYWAAFAPSQDGTLWAVGIDQRDRGVVGRWGPEDTSPELGTIEAPIDAAATMMEVLGGMVVVTSDERAWTSAGDMTFSAAGEPPPRLMLVPGEGGPEEGVTIDGLGTLAVFGSQEDGFTSRLVTNTGDVLHRLIDAQSRVRSVASLRALRSGHAVASLQREEEEAPDALVLTTDFGRTWLTDE